ncbi:MAG: outer membrane protein assembly factor BamE (lipoprotein component of BamABCDE complex) [Arcticibacterium sp.]|jgi:outer membrane protein assembly factor BamE (lipoprotein component of BamABCDE complex)
MKYRYKFVRTFIALLILVFLVFQYIVNWSPRAHHAQQNAENAKLLIKGMSKMEVLEIMGSPDKRRYSWNQNASSMDSNYFYYPPYAASDGVYVYFDSSGFVSSIIEFE